MKTKKLLTLSIAFTLILIALACAKTDETVTPTTATVTALTCSKATFSASATSGASYTATASVPYTGGSGVAYSAGTAIASTGVTGLTATLSAGTLANGAGAATFAITGTPTSVGTAAFAISVGGQSCSLSLTVGASNTGTITGSLANIITAIDEFKATLTATQISSLQLSLTKALAVRWSNLPCGLTCRNGLLYSSLSAAQLAAALKVIKLASGTTANEGYDEYNQVRYGDTYLGTKQNGYSEGTYIIAILGTPSATGNWMLQFGGHHYAQNVNFSAGKIVSNTPSHQAIEPLTWAAGTTTYAPLKEDHAAMLAVLSSFSATQLTSAKLSTTFSDVLLGPGKDGNFPATKLGVKVSTMTAAQKALVLTAIKAWVNDAQDETAATLLKVYETELDETYVSYSGNATLSANADYVRIDGPSVWIELVCQNGVVFTGIHYHAIYRDHTRDYNGL